MDPLSAVPTEHIAIADVFMHNKTIYIFRKDKINLSLWDLQNLQND
jgi:hypothetical protein